MKIRSIEEVRVGSTEMARNFSECLARVRYGGIRYVIEKNRLPVAELRPLAKGCTLGALLTLWENAGLDSDFANDVNKATHLQKPLKNPWV